MQSQAYGACQDSANIAQRIRTLLHRDDSDGVAEILESKPVGMRGELSEFERDLRDWGFVFGMAFAMTRSEDPWEPSEDAAARALLPAWGAYSDWSGDFRKPDRDAVVSRVVAEFHDDRIHPRGQMTVELYDALVDLANKSGS